MMNITIDEAAEPYKLGDFKLAIADYLQCHAVNFNTVGGRHLAASDCDLPITWIQIWNKMCIQCYSYHDLSHPTSPKHYVHICHQEIGCLDDMIASL